MSDNKKWHLGPPPSIGWWIASACGDKHMLRWWDGNDWSAPVHESRDASYAAETAAFKASGGNDGISWKNRPASWPARSKT
jgi:hypothetical protein